MIDTQEILKKKRLMLEEVNDIFLKTATITENSEENSKQLGHEIYKFVMKHRPKVMKDLEDA